MKRHNTTHKQHYHAIVVIVVAMMCITLCACKKYWCEKEGQDIPKYIVYKFHEGEDYSQFFLISDSFKLQASVKPGINRPIPLRNGYYLHVPLTDRGPWSLTYLNFTFDELETGLVPDDWNIHWEEYVLVDCPYKEYYSVEISDCYDQDLQLSRIGYCGQCSNTYYVDTAWLNRGIDNGEFFELESVKKYI